MKNPLDGILFSQFAGFYSSKNIRAKKRKISLYWKTPDEKLMPGTFKESVKICRSQSSVCFQISTISKFLLQLKELDYSELPTKLLLFIFFKEFIKPPSHWGYLSGLPLFLFSQRNFQITKADIDMITKFNLFLLNKKLLYWPISCRLSLSIHPENTRNIWWFSNVFMV